LLNIKLQQIWARHSGLCLQSQLLRGRGKKISSWGKLRQKLACDPIWKNILKKKKSKGLGTCLQSPVLQKYQINLFSYFYSKIPTTPFPSSTYHELWV
jgi:hypothetical protein